MPLALSLFVSAFALTVQSDCHCYYTYLGGNIFSIERPCQTDVGDPCPNAACLLPDIPGGPKPATPPIVGIKSKCSTIEEATASNPGYRIIGFTLPPPSKVGGDATDRVYRRIYVNVPNGDMTDFKRTVMVKDRMNKDYLKMTIDMRYGQAPGGTDIPGEYVPTHRSSIEIFDEGRIKSCQFEVDQPSSPVLHPFYIPERDSFGNIVRMYTLTVNVQKVPQESP